jgi:hypothetical protein
MVFVSGIKFVAPFSLAVLLVLRRTLALDLPIKIKIFPCLGLDRIGRRQLGELVFVPE